MQRKHQQEDVEQSPQKRAKTDQKPISDISALKDQIAKRLAAAAAAQGDRNVPLDAMTEVQRKLKLAKDASRSRQAEKQADEMMKATIKKVHDEEIRAKGGLNVAYHPALAMNIDPKARIKNRQAQLLPSSKHSTSLTNIKLAASQQVKEKPVLAKKKEINLEERFEDVTRAAYYDSNLVSASGFAPKPRNLARTFKFIEPGKFVDQANEQRQMEDLERLKREIADAAEKAGIERELELVANAGIRTEAPPSIEWWDAKLVVNESYKDFNPDQGALQELINNIVQHPVPIEPPAEDGVIVPQRAVLLTKQERKKLRRTNRMEAQREKQDKIRLGLLPQDKPKVTKANFMRVLGQEAILAPSMVEAEMAKQVKERQQKHKDSTEAQKLTEEERKAKKDKKLREDTSVLAKVAVYKINNLEHRQHLYKINTNAQQYKLTGVGIINPGMNLVIVEGGPKGIGAYKKLMMKRIDWQGRPEGAEPFKEPNECELVWEGEVKNKAFKNFRLKTLNTNTEVKEYLSEMQVAHYWNAAKNNASDAF